MYAPGTYLYSIHGTVGCIVRSGCLPRVTICLTWAWAWQISGDTLPLRQNQTDTCSQRRNVKWGTGVSEIREGLTTGSLPSPLGIHTVPHASAILLRVLAELMGVRANLKRHIKFLRPGVTVPGLYK